MIHTSLKTLVFALGCLFVMSSCTKYANIDSVQVGDWTPELAAPLVNTSLTTEDLLGNIDNTTLQVAPDQFLTLIYEGEDYFIDSDSLFELIPDFQVPVTFPDSVFAFPYDLPNGIDISFIDVRSGFVSVAIVPQTVNADVTVYIPELTLNGVMFEETFPVSTFGAVKTYDVSNYTLTPNQDTLFLRHKAVLTGTTTPYTLQPASGGGPPVIWGFSDFTYLYAEGYLGPGSFNIDRDTIEVDFYNTVVNGNFYFEDPKIIIDIDNAFGFPVRISVPTAEVITTNGSIVPINSPTLASGVNINYPLLSEVGQSKQTQIIIDQTNSDLPAVLAAQAQFIDYQIVPLANPDADPTIVGFFDENSFFSLKATVELPLWGYSTGFSARDTIAIDLSEFDDVIEGEFVSRTTNGFPIDADMQIYFRDASGNVIDSLLTSDQRVIAAAPVGSDDRVISSEIKDTRSAIDETRWAFIKNSTVDIVIAGKLTTLNNGSESVKIYNDYQLDTRLAFRGTVRLN